MSNKNTSIILVILDGWGIAPPWAGNAIFLAKTPFYDKLLLNYPNTTLTASGKAVGLPENERGNSEAGHLNLGAGKIVHQDVDHIFNLIKTGEFFENRVLNNVLTSVLNNRTNLHLMGLLSDAGIHSHIDHLFALIDLCKKRGVSNFYIHIFTDGRDTEPQKALSFVEKLESKLNKVGAGKIASISGRYYAMDRDRHWERIKKAYLAIVNNEGPHFKSSKEAISNAYRTGLTDEYILPCIINTPPKISDGDAVIFFNIRGDRAIQLTKAIADPDFKEFKRKKIKNLTFVTFTWLGDYIKNTNFAFSPEKVESPLSKIISENGLRQFHIAETEKYAHVTYFFNGGRNKPYPLEEWKLIPSPRVTTYDLKPEMKALEIAKEVVEKITTRKYQFILINFANPDMVGHTGNLQATVKAIEAVDRALEIVIKEGIKYGYQIIVTADHGNAEEMINPKTGEINPEHTTNKVPFILVNFSSKNVTIKNEGILADVAPTILNIMGIEKPFEMTGDSLL